MYKLQSFSRAKLAETFSRLSSRLHWTGGRPSAPLGSRILTNTDDIFKHNMWDHVQWTEEDKENARKKAKENSCTHIPLEEQGKNASLQKKISELHLIGVNIFENMKCLLHTGKFDTEACQYWDKFYKMHQKKFFKDRKWLFLEFPELLPSGAKSQTTNGYLVDQQASHPQLTGSSTDTDTRIQQHNRPTHRNTDTPSHQKESCQGAAPEETEALIQTPAFPGQHASFRILEVGCGVGNSTFPIVNSIKETDAYVYCCDFSPCAIQLVKDHPDYHDSVCHAFVHDICEERASFPFPPQSLDVILAVFVLSSIHPERLQGIVNRLSTYLKYGGIFLFRDYGRFDFSQLRFKKGRCLSENFYTRGDGTCVYFFTKEEIHDLFSIAGLEEIQNLEDRRLQVNRGKKVAMHRVWMQSKYRKGYPPPPS